MRTSPPSPRRVWALGKTRRTIPRQLVRNHARPPWEAMHTALEGILPPARLDLPASTTLSSLPRELGHGPVRPATRSLSHTNPACLYPVPQGATSTASG